MQVLGYEMSECSCTLCGKSLDESNGMFFVEYVKTDSEKRVTGFFISLTCNECLKVKGSLSQQRISSN